MTCNDRPRVVYWYSYWIVYWILSSVLVLAYILVVAFVVCWYWYCFGIGGVLVLGNV